MNDQLGTVYWSLLSCHYDVIGTVIRTATVKLLETEREYVCSRCKQSFTMEADFEQFYIIPKPARLVWYNYLLGDRLVSRTGQLK